MKTVQRHDIVAFENLPALVTVKIYLGLGIRLGYVMLGMTPFLSCSERCSCVKFWFEYEREKKSIECSNFQISQVSRTTRPFLTLAEARESVAIAEGNPIPCLPSISYLNCVLYACSLPISCFRIY
jgi:hypothetical protein